MKDLFKDDYVQLQLNNGNIIEGKIIKCKKKKIELLFQNNYIRILKPKKYLVSITILQPGQRSQNQTSQLPAQQNLPPKLSAQQPATAAVPIVSFNANLEIGQMWEFRGLIWEVMNFTEENEIILQHEENVIKLKDVEMLGPNSQWKLHQGLVNNLSPLKQLARIKNQSQSNPQIFPYVLPSLSKSVSSHPTTKTQ